MAASEPKKDPLELVGKQLIGRYSVRERLAQGGMSVVYRGEDDRLHRPVCIKVFFGLDRSQQLYQTTYEHFVQEAFALSQLAHPNTLRIYDFGYLDEEPRSPFHVSELMTGGTLLGHVRRNGALAPAEALRILEPIVGALSEAHARGVVHRDIKPSNILFGTAGTEQVVKLADFGIAKANLDAAARTIPNRAQDTNAAAGMRVSLYSPGWAAPEQLRAEPVGPTADVYALGLLAAFMLGGRKLFSDDNFLKNLEERVRGDEYVEQAVDALLLAPPLTRALIRACKSDPAERPPTAAAFLDVFREAVRAVEKSLSDLSAIQTEKFDRVPSATPTPIVAARLDGKDFTAGNRQVRVVEAGENVELAGTGARIRLTILPGNDRPLRVHVRGLNCFMTRGGSRPTMALDLDDDAELELLAPTRDRLDGVRFAFGTANAKARHYQFTEATVAVPHDGVRSVMLDFGPGRDLVLVYAAGVVGRGP